MCCLVFWSVCCIHLLSYLKNRKYVFKRPKSRETCDITRPSRQNHGLPHPVIISEFGMWSSFLFGFRFLAWFLKCVVVYLGLFHLFYYVNQQFSNIFHCDCSPVAYFVHLFCIVCMESFIITFFKACSGQTADENKIMANSGSFMWNFVLKLCVY